MVDEEYEGPDHLSPEGARALAARIRDYWAKRGKAVVTRLVWARYPRHTAIRSDMVGGVPRVAP